MSTTGNIIFKATNNIHEFKAFQILAKQMYEADINIIIENGPLYCNILVGKAPFWQQ
jgi:hypothetical protein